MLVISARSLYPLLLSSKWMLDALPHNDSVLTIISQHIWIKIGIVLGILIIFEKFRKGKACMRIRISGGKLTISDGWAPEVLQVGAGGVPGGGGVSAGARTLRRQGEVHLFLCVSSVSADSLRRHFGEEGGRHLVMTKYCRVSLYRSLHLCMPRKLNTPLLLFSDLGAWFLNEIFRFLYCGARKAFLGHFGHIHGRRMSDCSSCTRPPCLAIVADMLKTYKTLVNASNNEIGLLPLPYTLP